LDWSVDGQFIQSNDASREILFWETKQWLQHVGSGSLMKDVAWHTWTCVLGFPVMGIWPATHDAADTASVCRSHNHRAVLIADDSCHIRVKKYPCLSKESGDHVCRAQSQPSRSVRMSADDAYFVAVGSGVFQWKLPVNSSPPSPTPAAPVLLPAVGGMPPVGNRMPRAARNAAAAVPRAVGGGLPSWSHSESAYKSPQMSHPYNMSQNMEAGFMGMQH
jgi:microtubule-associated protein-like 6